MMLCVALAVAACGNAAPAAPPPAAKSSAAKSSATMIPPAATAIAEPTAGAPAAKAPAAASACEDYFGFCVTAQATGAVNATGAGGWASSSKTDCTALAAAGAARILELPNLLAAGEQQIAVALTRIGAYTGPGTYTLAAVVDATTATGGAMPDMFPAVQIGSRAFHNGAGTTATVTINADGSGTLAAKNLAEMDAMQGATPDPNARLDFAMQWTCQGKK
jgi:hypothetical protein